MATSIRPLHHSVCSNNLPGAWVDSVPVYPSVPAAPGPGPTRSGGMPISMPDTSESCLDHSSLEYMDNHDVIRCIQESRQVDDAQLAVLAEYARTQRLGGSQFARESDLLFMMDEDKLKLDTIASILPKTRRRVSSKKPRHARDLFDLSWANDAASSGLQGNTMRTDAFTMDRNTEQNDRQRSGDNANSPDSASIDRTSVSSIPENALEHELISGIPPIEDPNIFGQLDSHDISSPSTHFPSLAFMLDIPIPASPALPATGMDVPFLPVAADSPISPNSCPKPLSEEHVESRAEILHPRGDIIVGVNPPRSISSSPVSASDSLPHCTKLSCHSPSPPTNMDDRHARSDFLTPSEAHSMKDESVVHSEEEMTICSSTRLHEPHPTNIDTPVSTPISSRVASPLVSGHSESPTAVFPPGGAQADDDHQDRGSLPPDSENAVSVTPCTSFSGERLRLTESLDASGSAHEGQDDRDSTPARQPFRLSPLQLPLEIASPERSFLEDVMSSPSILCLPFHNNNSLEHSKKDPLTGNFPIRTSASDGSGHQSGFSPGRRTISDHVAPRTLFPVSHNVSMHSFPLPIRRRATISHAPGPENVQMRLRNPRPGAHVHFESPHAEVQNPCPTRYPRYATPGLQWDEEQLVADPFLWCIPASPMLAETDGIPIFALTPI
ncbi:hypothetical protein OF83DRAFT_460447 [Amylostereum chailletii]|nr:hypothetical protein OF83DRAFT_460447 [Amylostereum chailletii]